MKDALGQRYGADFDVPETLADNDSLTRMAARGSCRHFEPRPVAEDVIKTLCAVALSAPSKSDLQQRDIIVISDDTLKARLADLLRAQDWISNAPHLLVFCGNNRRQRQIHDLRQRPFANDHLDAFFNASMDAGIALSAFVFAAEAAGLGCCPISTIRNDAATVSALLHLPDHVFPVAALGLGYPAHPVPRISMRLPLNATVHMDRFDDTSIADDIETYDAARHAARPMLNQRNTDRFGLADTYTWSEDKARQYTLPERTDFGAFIRAKGFKLD